MVVQEVGWGTENGLVWVKIAVGGGRLWIWWWNFGFPNLWGRGGYWVAEVSLAAQDGLCSMDLFIYLFIYLSFFALKNKKMCVCFPPYSLYKADPNGLGSCLFSSDRKNTLIYFHIRTVQHLDIIKVIYSPTNTQVFVLKTILKFTLKFTLKHLRPIAVQSYHLQGSHYPCLLMLHFVKIVNCGASVCG